MPMMRWLIDPEMEDGGLPVRGLVGSKIEPAGFLAATAG